MNGGGYSAISEALRTVDDSSKLPERFTKSLDFMRFSLAEVLFDTLVADESTLFSKIKSLHAVFPCSSSLLLFLPSTSDEVNLQVSSSDKS